MITAIANLATRNNDDALRGILTQHGITLGPATVPGASPSAAPPAGRGAPDPAAPAGKP